MLTKMLKSVKANVLIGLFLTIPVVATILIFNFLFKLATNWLPEGIFPHFGALRGGDLLRRILTLAVIIILFYVVGLLTRNMIGRRLYQLGDKALARIPFIKGIYITVRQISESLFTQRKTLFKEVVMVPWPGNSVYTVGFVTAAIPPSLMNNTPLKDKKEDCIAVFVPTVPNPTSGFLMVVAKSDVIPLEISVSDAVTFVMSAGAVVPDVTTHGDMGRPMFLDKLESWLKHDDGPKNESAG